MQNPTFIAQLVHQNEVNKRLASVNKKPRLPKQESGVVADSVPSDGQIIKYEPNSNDSRSVYVQLLTASKIVKTEGGNAAGNFYEGLGNSQNELEKKCHSAVTLTEMHSPAPGPDAVKQIARDMVVGSSHVYANHSCQASPEVATSHTKAGGDTDSREQGAASSEDTAEVGSRQGVGDAMVLELDGNVKGHFPDMEDGTAAHTADASRAVNDFLWQLFSPEPGVEPDASSMLDPLDCGEIPDDEPGLYGEASVDQLTHQLGDLH